MIPTRYLYSIIGALVLAIASLYGSTLVATVGRVGKLEQAKSQHDQELQDIHQDLLRIERLLERNNAYHSH